MSNLINRIRENENLVVCYVLIYLFFIGCLVASQIPNPSHFSQAFFGSLIIYSLFGLLFILIFVILERKYKYISNFLRESLQCPKKSLFLVFTTSLIISVAYLEVGSLYSDASCITSMGISASHSIRNGQIPSWDNYAMAGYNIPQFYGYSYFQS